MSPTRLPQAQREMLDILAFRWPRPCYLVSAGRGRVALVVTEMLVTRSLARLRGFMAGPTVRPLQQAGLIAPGVVMPLTEFITLPPYSGRQRGDSFRGYRVRITEAGFAAIGAEVPSRERALTWSCSEPEVDAALALLRQDAALAVMARCREATRGTPEGSVDEEIRRIRGD